MTAAVLLAGCATMGSDRLPNNFNVFFAASTVELSPESKDVVHRAALAIKAKHPKQIVVAGEPMTVAAHGFDPKLAEPRFEVVERALIAEGIDSNMLSRAALTDVEARVGPTGNRRVEIRLYGTR